MSQQFNFGRRVTNLLIDSGHTQTELAKYLGLKSQTVSHWISGLSYPTFEKLEPIARYFRLSLPEFFTEDSPAGTASPSLVFTNDRNDLNQIPPGSDIRVELRTDPEIGDVVLYKSGDEARFLRLAAYRDGISVLMSDKPGDPPVISKDSDSEIIGTATAILLKRQKKTASDGRSETGVPGEETSSSTIIYHDGREV